MQRIPLKWAATIGLVASALVTPAAMAADPENVIYGAEFEKGRIVSTSQEKLGREAFGKADLTKKSLKEDTLPPVGKIQPALEDLLAVGDPHDPVQVVVTYRDSLPSPPSRCRSSARAATATRTSAYWPRPRA